VQPEVHPKVAAMRRRMSTLRRRVVAGSVALFIALFGGLYLQLASGHDPGVSGTQQVASAPTSGTAASTTTTTDTTTTTPVTTSQS
jgi:hypothetical protein